MSHQDKRLGEDGEILIAAMTRPTMIRGLTLTSIVLSFYLPFMITMITKLLWALVLVPVLLLVSYLVCLKDVYLFSIAWAWTHLKTCPNQHIWGCRRYAPR
jgi:type IV secretion system protein VirB3